MRTALLMNAAAGSVTDARTQVEMRANEFGWDILLLEKDAGAATARRAAEEGYELVIAGGGDGTVRDVVQGLADAGQRAAFGVLPLGTGNDLARSLRMPLDVEAAMVALARAREENRIGALDLLQLTHGERTSVCANSLNGGIAPLIREQMGPELKAKLGPLAFVWGALSSLTSLKSWPIRYRVDGGAPLDSNFVAFVIANGSSVGGGTQVAPTARLDDGKLDLVIVPGDASLADLTIAAIQAKFADLFRSDCVEHMLVQSIELVSQPDDLSFTADGETVAEPLRRVQVLPSALAAVYGPEDA